MDIVGDFCGLVEAKFDIKIRLIETSGAIVLVIKYKLDVFCMYVFTDREGTSAQ